MLSGSGFCRQLLAWWHLVFMLNLADMCYIFVKIQFYNVYIFITVCYCVPHCLIANWHWRTQTAGISHLGVCRCSGIWQEAEQICYKWGKEPFAMGNLQLMFSHCVQLFSRCDGTQFKQTMIIRRYASPILLASMAHELVVQVRNWKVL